MASQGSLHSSWQVVQSRVCFHSFNSSWFFSLFISFFWLTFQSHFYLAPSIAPRLCFEIKVLLCWVGLFEKWTISTLLASESRLGNRRQEEMSEGFLTSLGCHLFVRNFCRLLKVIHSLVPPWCWRVEGAPREFHKSRCLDGPIGIGQTEGRTFSGVFQYYILDPSVVGRPFP